MEAESKTRDIVKDLLNQIRSQGESLVCDLAAEFDNWTRDFILEKAARYSGGLDVAKFIKILTCQKLTREANRTIAAVASCISRYEGMEGHTRAADIRLRKCFPDEDFDFEVYDQKSYV